MKLVIEHPIRVMRVIARMNLGGPAVQVSGLMRGIKSDEFMHQLYTGFCADDELDYLETVATDVQAIRIEGFGRRINLVGDLKTLSSLIKAIRMFKPHIIHTHTAKAGFLGRIASIMSLQPSIRIHTFHGHLLHGYFGAFRRLLVVMSERILATFTDQLLAVGEIVRAELLEAGIGKKESFGIMPPGLTLDILPNKKDSSLSLGLLPGRLRCAFVGRVAQIKRPDRLLDVVSELKRRKVNLEFIIVGDGLLLDACRERINQESLPVKIIGWQSDIETVLSAADMVVLTSDNEGTPLILIQAGMAGLPVVTTDVGSAPEVVVNGVTGFVTTTDHIEISDALEKLATSKVLRKQLGNAARAFTLANFGVKRLVDDHEKLYKSLLSSRAKS